MFRCIKFKNINNSTHCPLHFKQRLCADHRCVVRRVRPPRPRLVPLQVVAHAQRHLAISTSRNRLHVAQCALRARTDLASLRVLVVGVAAENAGAFHGVRKHIHTRLAGNRLSLRTRLSLQATSGTERQVARQVAQQHALLRGRSGRRRGRTATATGRSRTLHSRGSLRLRALPVLFPVRGRTATKAPAPYPAESRSKLVGACLCARTRTSRRSDRSATPATCKFCLQRPRRVAAAAETARHACRRWKQACCWLSSL